MIDKEIFTFFARFIEAQTGIAYSEVTFYQLESRLEAIAKQLDLPSIPALAQLAQRDGIHGPMKDLLIDLATNNETSFFRDTTLFSALFKTIFPNLFRAQSPRPIRIWSAASSTGQEIYSISMLLQEIQLQYPQAQWELFASDISDRVLAKASAGHYSQLEIQRGLSAQRLLSYFEQMPDEGNGVMWKVKPLLQKRMSFRRLNLIETWPSSIGLFEIILCRNVLIYQTIEQKRKVLAKLAQHLVPGGFLILGGSESLIGLSDDFEQEQFDGSILYKVKSSSKRQVS